MAQSEAEQLEANAQFVREKTAAGEIANFSQRDGYDAEAKPPLSAGFLRKLLLGLEDAKPLLPGVRIRGARLDGVLDLTDCAGDGLPALALEACDLPERLDLSGARLARLSLRGSRFAMVSGAGLVLDGELDFNDCAAIEAAAGAYLWLRSARIAGDVWGRNARLGPESLPEGLTQPLDALDLQSAVSGGNVALDQGFHAMGSVRLLGAKIDGTLQCVGGRFANTGGTALVATNATIEGDVLLRASGAHRFEAEGQVFLLGAKIGGSLKCGGGRFANAGGDALVAQGAEIGGDVLLRASGDHRFEAEGVVNLYGATIGKELAIHKASLKVEKGYALSLTGARIEGQLFAQNNTITGAIGLSGARLAYLRDDPATAWGKAKSTTLIGLDEIEISAIGAFDAAPRPLWRARARWLRRNTCPAPGETKKRPFSNQPWRQIGAAYERAGLHQEARRLRRAELAEANRFRPFWRAWAYTLFGQWMFGFGLSTTRATISVLVVWALGAGSVVAMDARGAFIAVQDADRPPLACAGRVQPALYALDVMLPILDLGQERHCEPGAAPGARLFQGFALPVITERALEEIALWRWGKVFYAIFAGAVAGFALLTWTGVFRPRGDR